MRFRQRLNLVTAMVGMISGLTGSLFFIAHDLYVESLQDPAGLGILARRDAWILLLVVLASALLSTIVSRYFNRSISDPMTALATASREVTHNHNFSIRLHPQGQQEVAQLIKAFNEMMAMLENREADLSSAHELFDRFMGHSPAVAIIKDSQLRYVFINDAGLILVGRRRDEVIGRTDLELWSTEVGHRFIVLDKLAMSEGTLGLHSFRDVESIPSEHGEQFYSLIRFRLFDSTGNTFLGCSGLDETERLTAERALKASEERYALAVRGASDGMWDWDVARQQAYFSDRCSEIMGERLGTSVADLQRCIHLDDLPLFKRELQSLVEGGSEQLNVEFRLKMPPVKTGSIVPLERWAMTRATALRNPEGAAVRIAGFVTDISQRKSEEAQLRRDAFHDSLTELPNRALFLERLSRAMERLRRHPEDLFAVLFLDLDGFKAINDTLGHSVGDQLLVATARRLQKQVRGDDTVARLGGDEFTVLLQELHGSGDVSIVCERLLQALREPLEVGQQSLRIGTSIGVALSASNYQRPEQMLADADAAMYLAKRSGKSTFRIFDAEMHRQAEARMSMEARLRQAVADNQLEYYYLPVVRLSDGRIVAVEALLRWNHPEHGYLEPMDFLMTAEDSGLLVPLAQSMVPVALSRWKGWREQHPELGIQFNLSVRQFQHPALIQTWLELTRTAEVFPEGITLEITERALSRDAAGGKATLQGLRDLGFRLALDDFGRGASSLDLLRNFPFTTVKIDQLVVAALTEGAASVSVAQGLIHLAVGLELECVAEGVENAGQARLVEQAGSQLGQGYLWSRPVPALAIDKLLQRDSLA